MSEAIEAVARIQKHFPLIPNPDDRCVVLKAIEALKAQLSAIDAEDDDDRPSIPSSMKARGYS